MIAVSHRMWDTLFVGRTIRNARLDPQPTQNFAALPGYMGENEAFRRVVERYPWGCVIFLSDKLSGRHATVVAEGEVNLTSGLVTDLETGTVESFNVPFYAELVGDLGFDAADVTWPEVTGGEIVGGMTEDGPLEWVPPSDDGLLPGEQSNFSPLPGAPISAPIKAATAGRPPCVGYHEEVLICDGGYVPGTGDLDPLCTWRDRCMASQEHCRAYLKTVEEVFAGQSDEQIAELTAGWLKIYGPYDPPVWQTASVRPVVALIPPGVDVTPGGASGGVETVSLEPPPEPPAERMERREKPGVVRTPRTIKPPPPPATAISEEAAREMGLEFWDKLLVRFGLDMVEAGQTKRVGACWLQEVKSNGPGYWTGYRQMPKGGASFIRIHLKPLLGSLHIHLPFPPEHPVFQRFETATSWKHGSFLTVIKGVGREVPMEAVIEACAEHVHDFGIGLTS